MGCIPIDVVVVCRLRSLVAVSGIRAHIGRGSGHAGQVRHEAFEDAFFIDLEDAFVTEIVHEEIVVERFSGEGKSPVRIAEMRPLRATC